jgi:hypothetical protein
VVIAGVIQTKPGTRRFQIHADEDLNHRHIQRKKQCGSGIRLGERGSFNLETAYRGDTEACQALILQPLPRSQGVLAHGVVSSHKSLAHIRPCLQA